MGPRRIICHPCDADKLRLTAKPLEAVLTITENWSADAIGIDELDLRDLEALKRKFVDWKTVVL